MQPVFELKIWIHELIVLSPLCPETLRATNECHNVSQFSKNVQKYHIQNHLASYKQLVRNSQCRYFMYIQEQFTPWTIHALSSTWKGVISIFKSNPVRARNKRTNSENVALQFCFLQPPPVPESVSVRVLQRSKTSRTVRDWLIDWLIDWL